MDQALKPYRISFDFKRVPRRLIVINFLLFFDFCVFLECIQSWFGVIKATKQRDQRERVVAGRSTDSRPIFKLV